MCEFFSVTRAEKCNRVNKRVNLKPVLYTLQIFKTMDELKTFNNAEFFDYWGYLKSVSPTLNYMALGIG